MSHPPRVAGQSPTLQTSAVPSKSLQPHVESTGPRAHGTHMIENRDGQEPASGNCELSSGAPSCRCAENSPCSTSSSCSLANRMKTCSRDG